MNQSQILWVKKLLERCSNSCQNAIVCFDFKSGSIDKMQKLDQTGRIILKVRIYSQGTWPTLGSLDSLETENRGLIFTLISIDHWLQTNDG